MPPEGSEMLTVQASSTAEEVDTLMVLLGPYGALVTSNGDSIGLNAKISRPIDAAETYTLVIGVGDGRGMGQVKVARV